MEAADKNDGPQAQEHVEQAYQHAHALLRESALAVIKDNGEVDSRAVLNAATAILSRAHAKVIEIIGEIENGKTE